MLAAAIGLAFLEKWCVKQDLPPYLRYLMSTVAAILSICDAVVLCRTTIIVALRLITRVWQNEG